MSNLSGTHIGGAETQQSQFAKGLRSLGYKVIFIVARPASIPEKQNKSLPNWVRVAYTLRAHHSKTGFLKDSLRLFREMKKIKADLYIQRCSFHDAPRIWLFSKILNSKFLFWVGSDFNVDASYQSTNLSKVRRIAYQHSIQHADAIVCQTKQQQEMLCHSFNIQSFLVKNITSIPVNLANLPKSINKKLTAIWGGRINSNKRPELLIQLAKELPNWSFIFVAIKDRCLEKEYDLFLEQASFLTNVKLLPSIPHKDYLLLTSQADIVLNTSITEGYPNTLLEAFVYKIPALTLGINPDNAITANSIGWVCSDIKEAKKILCFLETNPDKIVSYGNNARAYIEKNHSFKKAISDLNNVLQAISK